MFAGINTCQHLQLAQVLYMNYVGRYLFLRFKDGREIRQKNPSQTLMNLQYIMDIVILMYMIYMHRTLTQQRSVLPCLPPNTHMCLGLSPLPGDNYLPGEMTAHKRQGKRSFLVVRTTQTFTNNVLDTCT